jgi:hypothetical protein
LAYREHRFSITCEHVTAKAAHVYVLGIPSTDAPTPFGQKVTYIGPATVLRQDAAADLAVLDASDVDFAAAQKEPFDLDQSDFVTEEHVKNRIGALSFMCGAWGEKSGKMSLGKAKIYLETPLYFGAGPIVRVTSTAIISSFAERKELFRNVQDFPQLKDVQISGGSRDLTARGETPLDGGGWGR